MKCASVLACLLVACTPKPHPSPEPDADAARNDVHIDPELVHAGRVVVGTVEARTPRDEVSIPGDVVVGENGEAQVTSLVAGRVATLDVAIGQTVTKGQLVATVDSPQVGAAQADLLRAQSRAVLAKRVLARQLELDAQNATSKNAIDQARAEDAAATADALAARTLLANLGVPPLDPAAGAIASSRISMRSPIAGVVVERTAILGGPVSEGSTLLRIVAPSNRLVVAKLPDTLSAQASVGTRVRLYPRNERLKPPCEGTIQHNLHVVDATRSIPLRITIDDGCTTLSVGSFVDVRLPSLGAHADAGKLVLVPSDAIALVRGTSMVFIAAPEEGHFIGRAIQPGQTWGSDVAVISGVSDGERIVIEGVLLLKGELQRAEMKP
jgi:cobalt-zinc-cadmium efflux system membrane fusion protein